MQHEIESALAPLVGSRLIDLGRAASMQWFTFDPVRAPRIALHLQCEWSLRDERTVLVAEADYDLPAVRGEALTPRDTIGSRLRDVRNDAVRARLDAGASVVRVAAESDARFALQFANGWQLECRPEYVAWAEDDPPEQWRLLRPKTLVPHVVFLSSGFERAEA